LVGATAGYVGYEDGGQLTEQVRRKPYSVILFDEIEKAHSEVFNLMLQILEDGSLTDAKGKKVDFSNTIIVMTSNIGAEKLNKKASPIGFNLSKEELDVFTKEFNSTKEDIMDELKRGFRPEFLNRIDKIVIFDPLTHANVREIVKLHISNLQERLNPKKIKVNVTEGALDNLATLSYDPEYGARPARRKIQDLLEDEITQLLLDGNIGENSTISVIKKGTSVELKVA
jgi:ATP-dependent Clp protease ATP-binding subunit ClpC